MTWPSISTLSKSALPTSASSSPVSGAHRDEGSVGGVVLGEERDLFGDDGLGGLLELRIKSGGDVEAGLVEGIGSVERFELLPHVEREMGRLKVEALRSVGERFKPGGVCFCGGDEAVFDHQV